MIAQYHSVERELNKIFSENIIESPFSESGKNILEIDEAALFDSYVLGDMDVDPNKTSIEILEKGADVSFFGIEIPRKSHGKIMQDRSLAAIDGSSTIVNRSFISMVVAKAGMGSYGRGTKIPLSEAISEDFKILLSTDQVVKKEHEKIEKLPSRNPRSDALRMTATALQAKLEIQGIKYA